MKILRIAVLSVILLSPLILGGCAILLDKKTEFLGDIKPPKEKIVFFKQSVVMADRESEAVKKEILPVDKDVMDKVTSTIKKKLHEQGIKVKDGGNIEVSIYTSYYIYYHWDRGPKNLKARAILMEGKIPILSTKAHWSGALTADYDRGVESISEFLANEIALWFDDKPPTALIAPK